MMDLKQLFQKNEKIFFLRFLKNIPMESTTVREVAITNSKGDAKMEFPVNAKFASEYR